MLIEGDVLKADNTRYADADLIALGYNGPLYLFSSLKLTLADGGTSHLSWFGYITSLFSEPFISTYLKGCELAQGWFPDTKTNATVDNTGFSMRQNYLIQKSNPIGSFKCAIPMRHKFGFVYHYDLWDARYIVIDS